MNRISEITRRDIFDNLHIENFIYNGRLEESDFLSRIFTLEAMPTSDSRFENVAGDIWQHRVNNDDWPDNWIFTDSRFNLSKCDDSVFLQFICETVHPIVRHDLSEVNKLVQIYNEHLKDDGYEIVEKSRISNRPLFAGRQRIAGQESIKRKGHELTEKLNADYVTQQIHLMESSIEFAPHLAIGTAKELIETCCKKILEERKVPFEKTWDLVLLVKNTNKELKLSPTDIADDKKAAKTIKSILNSLTAIVQGLCELRNDYGSGHGKHAKFIGLGPRHAKLAVGAATTFAVFLLETHELK